MSYKSVVASLATLALPVAFLGLVGSGAVPALAQPGAFEAPLAISDHTAVPVVTMTQTSYARAGFSDDLDTEAKAPGASPALSADSAEDDDSPPLSLAALVTEQDVDAPLDSETRCLATTIFYESRSESLAGQFAVARVVINRARSKRFPSSLCAVVKQPHQFSFVRGGRLPTVNSAGTQWRNALALAQIALTNGWKSEVEGALYFHASRVSPGWGRQRLAQIDNHIFYR